MIFLHTDMLIYITLLIFIAGNVSGEDESFSFSETPTDISVSIGSTALLKCSAYGKPDSIHYFWMKNGERITTTGRKGLTNFGNLRIKHASDAEDSGEYVCGSENLLTGQRISSKPAKLRILWLENDVSVVLTDPKQADEITSTKEVTLECRAKGSSVLKISWLRNGERITKTERIIPEDNRLRIKSITPADNGVYRCTASNGLTSVVSLRNFILAIPNNDWATIHVPPQDQIVKESTSARIDCVYKNADITEWYFQEKLGPIDNSTRFTVLSNGSLIVNNMTKLDEGLYSCIGIKQDSAEVPQKYTAQLYVSTLASMDSTFLEPQDPSTHIVAEGLDFEIQCYPPSGMPTPVISWKGPSGEVIGTSGRIRIDGHRLLINHANVKSDSGKYTCKVENLAGIQEVSFVFTVAVPPTIKKHPTSQKVNEGSDVLLTCEYTGVPYPHTRVLWFKEESPVPANSTRIHVDVINGILRFTNIELSDAGNYYCLVNTTTVTPAKSKFAALNIEQKLKFHPLPVGKKMELGMVNKIPCKAEGKDVPSIKWLKGNSPKSPTPFPSRIQDLNGTLYFTNVQKEDQGKYTCVATNSQGEIEVVIDVDVVVTPKFTAPPKNPSEGFEGFQLLLNCSAEGDPQPSIQWDNKNVDLNQKRFHVLPNGSLLIDELHLSDEGYYGCTAGNSGGFNRTEVTVLVRSSDNLRPDGMEGDTVGKTVAITLGAACAYILLVIILMAWCRYRRRKQKQAYMDANIENTHLDEDIGIGKYNPKNSVELKQVALVQNGNSHCVREDGPSSQSTSRSRRLAEPSEKYSFSRKYIHNIMLLGKGEFGNVFLGQNSQNSNAVVMIKVLEKVTDEFNRQLEILTHVEHEHLVKLIGICQEAKPHYMILEYTDWGDLKQFLIATRKSSVGVVGKKERPAPLTVKQSLNIIAQAASVLEFMNNKNYSHRDVAARNCLITSSLNVKITFSSLCQTNYAAEYFSIRNQLLPLRWLPREAIVENNFSTTDVYMFGCLIWEVFTKAELPFSKISNKDFLQLLERKQLQWKLPQNMPPQLGNLANKCWNISPSERPSFAQIQEQITTIVNGL